MFASSGSPPYINSYIKSTKTELCHIVSCQFRQWNSSAWILTHIQYITRNKGYIYEQYNFIKSILLCLWNNQNNITLTVQYNYIFLEKRYMFRIKQSIIKMNTHIKFQVTVNSQYHVIILVSSFCRIPHHNISITIKWQ
jgi:hypothetical protein